MRFGKGPENMGDANCELCISKNDREQVGKWKFFFGNHSPFQME